MRRIELNSIPAVLVILGAIVLMALVVLRFDDFYLEPVCQRFEEEKGLEYASHHGWGRYNRFSYCSFRLYNADGSFNTMVQVPVSSMRQTPFERTLGLTRWLLIAGILIPAVWFARKLAGMDD